MNPILWQPDPERTAATQMTAFTRYVEKETDEHFPHYRSLWQWSIKHPELFWPAVWNFCGVQASRSWDEALVDPQQMPGARWFVGAELNFAQNLLRGDDAAIALLFRNEQGQSRQLTFANLRLEVARVSSWLNENGIQAGDRVAAWMPNLPETVVMLLAAAAIGATFSSCSPDFGIQAVVERFSQIEPVVLLVADRYTYGGKHFELLPKVQQLVELVPSIKQTLVVSYNGDPIQLDRVPNSHLWTQVGTAEAKLDFVQLPFDHPLYILYSSGTTGSPKCIVHGAGGTLLQHLKEQQLHSDLRPGDRLFYFTTCGWMMWNWLVTGLASGATIILYDGSPVQPEVDNLFQMADELGIHVFGTSAGYLAALEKQGSRPGKKYSLQHLRTILSTGSPLAEESFEYVYREIKADVCLSSISGGTDIVSCFALGNPNRPVRRGELQCRGLGMAVDIFDTQGHSIVGEKGELVCTQSFPSMPLGFWRDTDNRRYHGAYFDRYPDIWCHGDFALLTAEGGMVIYGRSDAVLNPGGVRIGTAEIYAQVMQVDEVVDCVAVGQDWEGDSRIVLFVQLRDGINLDDPLREKIGTGIRHGTSPRHVPSKILSVPDIPRTRSGKTAELAVRETLHGRAVKSIDALANPESLTAFKNRSELEITADESG